MDGTSSCREIRTARAIDTPDVNDKTIDELRELVKVGFPRAGLREFAAALVERIDRQERTIRDLFADVVRQSIGEVSTNQPEETQT